MKFYLLFAAMLAAAAFALPGCADQTSNTNRSAAAPATITNPSDRTYSRDDLNKTGRQSTGEAIQALDPSVTTTGR